MLYNTDIDNSMVLARGKGGEVGRGRQGGGRKGMERDFTFFGQRAHNGVEDVLLSGTLKTCLVLLTFVTLIS